MRVLFLGTLVFVVDCSKPDTVEPAPSTLKADAKGVDLSPDAPQWKYVELAVAGTADPIAPLAAPGRVAFDEKRTSDVGSPLSGRTETVMVRLGDTVKQGDRLFSVRSGAWADLDREAETARSQEGLKKRVVERSRELYALKAIAEKDLIAAEAELKEAGLALKAAEAKKQSLQVVPGGDNLFFVRAPRAGTIVEHDLYSNQEVVPEREKPLLRISELDEVLVLADVPENDAGDLAINEPVTIRSQAGSAERKGIVEHISEVVDVHRRTVEVRVRVENHDRALRPNSFVEVIPHPVGGEKRIRVPDAAIVSEGTRSVIFVSRGSGRLEPVQVVQGRRRDGEVEIRSGLEPGTKFVAKGALLLLNQIDLVDQP